MGSSSHFSKLISSRLAHYAASTPTFATIPPLAVFTELVTALEAIRLMYLYHRFDVIDSQFQELEQRLDTAQSSQTESDVVSRFQLVQASLLVLRARMLARRKSGKATEVFRKAAETFGQQPMPEDAPVATARFQTDFAIALHRLKRFEESKSLLETVCNGASPNADSFAYLGYARRQERDWKEAETCFRKSLDSCEAQPTVLYWLGRSLLDQNLADNTEAEAFFCRGGEYALSVGDYHTATKCGGRALRVNPSNVAGLRLAVEGFRGRNKSDRALQLIDTFLQNQPGSVQALVLRGVLLRDLQRLEESVEVLQSIPKDGPEHDWVIQELLNSLYEWIDAPEEDLLRAAEAVLERAPQHLMALYAKGKVRLAQDRPEEALQLFESAVEQSAKSGTALLGLGESYKRLQRRDKAFSCYRRAARTSGGDPRLFVEALAGMRDTGDRQDVLDALDSLSSGPLGYFALWLQGDIYNEHGERAKALASLEKAAEGARKQDQETICLGLFIDYGHALRYTGRYSEAERVFKRMRALDGQDPEVLGAYARLKSDFGEFRLALELLHDAMPHAPRDARLWDHAGWCMQHLIDLDGAWKAFKQAYELNPNPWYRKGFANVLMNYPDQRETANAHFQAIVDELKYTHGVETSQERPAGNLNNLGLLAWCNYRLGHTSEAIRLLQLALDGSPDIHPLWFDLTLAFLASGRGQLARQAYAEGCKRTEGTEVPRQRGVYYVAAFDLAELVRESGDQLPPESNKIFMDLRSRLERSGQDLSELAWLPVAVNVCPPPKREDALEIISEMAKVSDDKGRRLALRELLRAAAVRFRDENWSKDLLLRAHAENWPAWAVQCLSIPEYIDFAYPDGPRARFTLLWRVVGDILVQGRISPSWKICADEVYLFEELPENLKEPVSRLREELEDVRTSFPYSDERGCRVAALERISDVGRAVFAALSPDPDNALIEFRKLQLKEHGLAPTAVVS